MITNHFLEVVIKIEVKDNNVEQALRVLKENSKDGFFKVIKLKNNTKTLKRKKFFKKILKELKVKQT